MRSTKTTKEKLIERINALKELPRTLIMFNLY